MQQNGDHARYIVERGTDGSWLVVDRGDTGGQRVAISRETTEQAARSEADTLSGMEDVLSTADTPLDPDLDRLVTGYSDQILAEHNFNHLLTER